MSGSNSWLARIIGHVKNNYVFYVVFLLYFSYCLLWLLSFFPAVMSSDAFSHWTQSSLFQFNDAHPYIYALLFWLLRKINDSPLPISLFQVFIFSFFISYVINYFYKKRVSKIVLALILLALVMLPIFGIYTISLWKDILFTIFVISSLLVMATTVIEKDNLSKKELFWRFLFLGIFSVLAMMFRHNGLPFLILNFFTMLIFFYRRLKEIILPSIIILILVIIFKFIIPWAVNLEYTSNMTEPVYIRAVGSIFQLESPNLSSNEKAFFVSIMPEETWKNEYLCTYMNVIDSSAKKNGFYNKLGEDNFKTRWHEYVVSAVIKNPKAIIKDKLCLTTYLTGYRENPFKYYVALDYIGPYYLTQSSKLPKLENLLISALNLSASNIYLRNMCWSIFYQVIITIFVAGFSLVKKLFGTFFYCFSILLNLAFLILVTPASDFRYVYFVYLGFVFLPLLIALEQKKIK